MKQLLRMGALELASAIRQGQVSAIEATDAHIDRLARINPHVNGLVEGRFDAARTESEAADKRIERARVEGTIGELPPLLGVPCTMKEFVGVEGMPHTGGLYWQADRRAEKDGTVVKRIRDAGAVILGVSNAPEGGLWMETVNKLTGRTLNPWDPRRTSGGSSGGEGALLASGAAPFGMGSDIGGSIRIPSAFCGIPGHKPTGRLVPNTGHYPGVHGDQRGFLVIGPMGRTVRDFFPLLSIIAGPDDEDPVTQEWSLEDPASIDLSDVTVYPVESNGRMWMHTPAREAIRQAARLLEEQGATIGHIDVDSETFKLFRNGFDIWGAAMSAAGGPSYADIVADGQPIPYLKEWLGVPFGRSRHTWPVLTMMAAERLVGLLPGRLAKMLQARTQLQASLESLLGPRGVLLHPTYTRGAPRHGRPMLTPLDPACTAIFNALEFPATQVPVSTDRHGLPLGIQVVGKRGADGLTLAVAQALEDAGCTWRMADPGKNGRP